jgi:hypothetical protein
MKRFIQYFELDRKYQFDINDVVATIYALCAIGIMLGFNMNILFFIGATIATAVCWKARRLNLVLLNVAMFALNLFNVIKMF